MVNAPFFPPFTFKSKKTLQTPLYIYTVHKWSRVTSNKMQNLEINIWRKKYRGIFSQVFVELIKSVKMLATSLSECRNEICSVVSTTLTLMNVFEGRICHWKLVLDKAGSTVWESTIKGSVEVFSQLGGAHSILSRMYLSALQPARS